jgi:hypothetical protein
MLFLFKAHKGRSAFANPCSLYIKLKVFFCLVIRHIFCEDFDALGAIIYGEPAIELTCNAKEGVFKSCGECDFFIFASAKLKSILVVMVGWLSIKFRIILFYCQGYFINNYNATTYGPEGPITN